MFIIYIYYLLDSFNLSNKILISSFIINTTLFYSASLLAEIKT